MKYIRKIQRTIIFSIKILMFVCLFFAFFGLYYPSMSIHLFRFNRASVITASTFAIVGVAFIQVYGGFAIGKKKSKEITYTVFLAALITDIITYLQLSVMARAFASLYILILIIAVHYLICWFFARFGNYVYFKINSPEKCAVFYNPKTTDAEAILKKFDKYKKQYIITDVADYNIEDFRSIILHNDAVCLLEVPAEKKSEIISYCYKHNKNIYLLPDLSDVVINYSRQTMIDDTVMLASNQSELSVEQRIIKRTVDIILSAIGIIITSPIMLIEAIAIKIEDGGPVFFKQERITKNEKTFKVLKFRTMIENANSTGYRLTSDKDDRITKVGAVLRKLRIDELPQFFNVLKGDMSLVGPRPEVIELVEKYSMEFPEFHYRHRVKAGLTGLAQIMGKYNTSPKDKLMLDLMYIENYSVWADFKLMFQTLIVLFKSDSTEGVVDKNKPGE